ncbi:hypothetical protein [Nocardioides jiangxiensis]|uniref:Uncharacterized protein n=1 Tax=Nocardioides jiangxiensis TaxID=3064524 RepID=A0ABT9B5X3_9ACTN|nr:hypothetical protein [Nocardioides sp. WY-20]MDO7869012.1 hypothetical protein [Nocardioides sp. WY-20]
MAWFLRVHELHDGTFECRRGREHVDGHGDADAAVAHMLDLADDLGLAIVFMHRLDGTVSELARVGTVGQHGEPSAS